MRKIARNLLWITVGAGLLFGLLAVALGLYTNSEHFRRLVRDQLVAAVNGSIGGSISLGKIEGSIWGSVTLHDVALSYREAEIVRVPRLVLSFALLPLVRGQLVIARAEAAEPSVEIVRDDQGRWNIAEALSSEGEATSQFSLLLHALAVRNGSLNIRLDGTVPKRYRLRDFAMQSRLAMLPSGIEFEAGIVRLTLESEELPKLIVRGGVRYQDGGTSPTVSVKDLSVETAASRLKLTGKLVDFDQSQISAKLTIDKLDPVDLTQIVQDWPLKAALRGTVAIDGPFQSLAVTADLAAAGANLKSDFTVDVSAASPRYHGKMQITGFDARALLEPKDFTGVLDGGVEVQGVGFTIDHIDGTGNFSVRSAQVKDWQLGNLRFSAALRDRRMAIQGELSGGIGSAEWRGNLTLAPVPDYHFDVAVKNLDIQRVSGKEKKLAGVLSFTGKVKGSGATLAQAKGDANMLILPSTIGPVRVQKGELAASIGGGRLRIARGSLQSDGSMLAVKGDIGLDLKQRGNLDYEFRTADLSPWLNLVERKGSGSLALAGNAQGRFDELTTRGRMKISRIKLDQAAVDNGEVNFALARKSDPIVPEGKVTLKLTGLDAGVRLEKLDASVSLTSSPSRAAQIDAQAQDPFGRSHFVNATVHYGGEEEIVATLTQLGLGLPDGRWSLARPAVLRKRSDGLRVESFDLRNQGRRATVDGFVALRGQQALNLAIDNFPLEAVADWLPNQPKMTGLVALHAQVSGTAAAPEISSTVKLTDPTIGGQSYAGLVADVGYQGRRVSLRAVARQDSTHSLTATGSLPLLLSWSDGWRSEISGDMDLRVNSSGFSLAFLNAYTGKAVTGVGGEVSLDLSARGALAAPVLSGNFRLTDGRLKATPLNVEVIGISVHGAFDTRAVKVRQFTLRAKDGRIDGSAAVSLKNFQIDNFRVTLVASRWPMINTRRYQAEVGGNVEVGGPLAAPKLSGNISITEANIRPDLAFLERSSTPVKRDESIVVVSRAGNDSRVAVENNQLNGYGNLLGKSIVDLSMNMPRNVWVRHPNAVAELTGKIHATKKAGQNLQLVGSSEIIRGWAAFQGRRFNFERGEIRFVGGGTIDPTLDIVARHRLPHYTVDAVVGGTAANPTLSLRSDPSLNQTDILALLLFGKPTKDLNRTEQASLRENALEMAGGFAAARIGSAVAQAIGLDSFGLGEFDFDGGRVGFGRYIGSKTYVTAGQEFAGERGQEARLEYQLAPDWKIGTSTTSKGESGAEIIWHKRY